MTPKEKAKELFDKYATYVVMWTGGIEVENQNCKQCALIAVDEILKVAEPSTEQVQYTNGEWAREYREIPNRYWTEVKQEIENL